MVFITTTAEPLSAFLMTISGLSDNSFKPILYSFVKFGLWLVLTFLMRRPNLNDLWKISRNWCTLFGFQVLAHGIY